MFNESQKSNNTVVVVKKNITQLLSDLGKASCVTIRRTGANKEKYE